MTSLICPENLAINTVSVIPGQVPALHEPLTIQAFRSSCRAETLFVFELDEAKAEITTIAGLPANWDGYNALPIQQETKNNALAAAAQILTWAPTSDISPNPNGTISMEWESDYGLAYLEIGKTKYSFFIDRKCGTTLYSDGAADTLLPYLGLLIQSTLFPAVPASGASIMVGENAGFSGRCRGF
jgi:hypothetical protein